MMEECQDTSSDVTFNAEKGQRPLYVGSFLMGLGLCCLFFVYPSMMLSDMEVSETKAHHLMALICVMAAFTSPFLAFGSLNCAVAVSLLAFVAFVACHIFKFVGLGWTYFAAGPFLAFVQWGHFSLLAGKAKVWLEASKAAPHMIIALVVLAFFQSKDGFKNALLAFNIIVLALAGLCHMVHMASSISKDQSKHSSGKEVKRTRLFWFYLRDNQLHLLLPMVFFTGLFEAFMSKEFIMVSTKYFPLLMELLEM